MKAIETIGEIDKKGFLRIDRPLKTRDKRVKVIILMSEDDAFKDETTWLSAISGNPAFDFLNEPEEDIYSTKDGKPFND
ncbi:MAG: hypothetical protein H8D45_05490 [Bacteroidetes bacterium]|nr:hypothetical protein [Bacteroidota bacterium]MBL7104815.1 hypothetical protein [Bacteroidales bacterium]